MDRRSPPPSPAKRRELEAVAHLLAARGGARPSPWRRRLLALGVAAASGALAVRLPGAWPRFLLGAVAVVAVLTLVPPGVWAFLGKDVTPPD
jgi:hypothetical protein